MIVSLEQLSSIRKKHAKQRIVFAGGVFDLLHRGHIAAFKDFRKHGDILVIAVSSDARVRERKGPARPILEEDERVLVLDAIKYVDYVLVAPKPDPQKELPTIRVLRELRPDFFASSDERWLQDKEKFKAIGVRFKFVKRNRLNSTTQIIQKILKKHVSLNMSLAFTKG